MIIDPFNYGTFTLNDVFRFIAGDGSCGAMVLSKFSVPGRPTDLDNSSLRAISVWACSKCGWGLFGHFFSRLSFLSSFSLSPGEGPT